MKRGEYMRSSFGLMIVVLLFCSIVCSSLDSTRFQSTLKLEVCLKNPNSHNLPATPIPAKIETENDYKHENNFFFIQQLIGFIPSNSPELQRHSNIDAFCFLGNVAGVPLYMSKRSFLI